MALTKPEQYLGILKRSNLLDAEQFAQAKQIAAEVESAERLAKTLARKGLLTWWQASQVFGGRTEFFVGKYKLIRLLGSGGMGRVFVAEHTTMNRPVALKIISRDFCRAPAAVERFFTEARAVAALDHPNIVHAYDVDKEADRHYIVMEYVEGKDLQRTVETDGPLEVAQAVDYVRQAAEGLAHAHGRNMVHCDVKPANLLVNEQGVVKILDMGMARVTGRDTESAIEQDEGTLGTVNYMAPEQAVADPERDHRVDLYSLGCTLYFLLTGRPPFPEGTLHERILKHQTSQPTEITEIRPEVPESLAEICRKMMAKDPADRFASAAEVSEVLSTWDAGEEGFPVIEAEPADDAAHAAIGINVGGDGASNSGKGSSSGEGSGIGKQEKDPKRQKMIILGSLGGLAAVVLLVCLIFAFSGSGSDAEGDAGSQTASSDTSSGDTSGNEDSAEETPVSDVTEEGENWLPELDVMENLTTFDPETVAKEGAATPDKPADSDKPGEEAQQPGAAESVAEEPGPGQAGESQPAETVPDNSNMSEATPEPDSPAAETPVTPKDPKPADPQPAGPGDSDTQQPPPEEPKPEKPKDPFSQLAESVDLPEHGLRRTTDAQPVGQFTLGNIQSGPGIDWQLFLIGGDTALRGTRQFVIQRKDPDPAKASWVVQLESAATSTDPAREDMANIWRDADALLFQWVEDAAPSSANYLRNCILQIRVQGQSKYMTLTQPKQVDSIDVDLVRGVVNTSLPVKWLPDPDNLRVEITKIEGREGHLVEPAEPASPKTPLLLSFPRKDRHGNTNDSAAFRLSFTPRATAMGVKLQLLEPPANFFRGLNGNVIPQTNRYEMARDQVDKKLNPKNNDQAPRGNEKSTLNAQLDEIEMALWYIEFYDTVQGKAKLHFRITTDVAGRQIVLASSSPGEPGGTEK